jgi:hypothetical protein
MVLMVAEDVRRVPTTQIEAAQTMGASRGEIIELVLLPAAKPALLDTLRITMGWAWTYLGLRGVGCGQLRAEGYAILKAQAFPADRQDLQRHHHHRHDRLLTDQLFRWLHRWQFPVDASQAMSAVAKIRRRASSARSSAMRRVRCQALMAIDLEVFDNEFVTLVGASGCGKSTLLQNHRGWTSHTSGEHRGERQAGDRVPVPIARWCFQHYSLYPWLT